MKKPKRKPNQAYIPAETSLAKFRKLLKELDYIGYDNYRPLSLTKPTTKWAFDMFCLFFLPKEEEAIKNLKQKRKLFDKLVNDKDDIEDL